jgi:hypothetical protein
MGWAAGIAQGVSSIGSTVANAVLAAQTRKWMEHMRDTQYQAAVRDLGKAGLNTALAFGGGNQVGASGPTAQVEDGGQMMGRAIETGISSARQGASVKPQVDILKSEASQEDTKAAVMRSQADEMIQAPRLNNDLLRQEFMKNIEQMKLMRSQTENTNAQTLSTDVGRAISTARLPGEQAKGKIMQEAGKVVDFGKGIVDSIPDLWGRFKSGAQRDQQEFWRKQQQTGK